MARESDKKHEIGTNSGSKRPKKAPVPTPAAGWQRHLLRAFNAAWEPIEGGLSWSRALVVLLIAVFAMWLISFFLAERGFRGEAAAQLSLPLGILTWGGLCALVRLCEVFVRRVVIRSPKYPLPTSLIAFYGTLVFAGLSAFGRLGVFWRDVIGDPVTADLDWLKWFPTLAVTVMNALVIFALLTAWLCRPLSLDATSSERQRWRISFLSLCLVAVIFWFLMLPVTEWWSHLINALVPPTPPSEQGTEVLPCPGSEMPIDLGCFVSVTVFLLFFVPLILIDVGGASFPMEICLPSSSRPELKLPAPFFWYTVIALVGGVTAYLVDSTTGQRDASVIAFAWFMLLLAILATGRFIRAVWHHFFPNAWRANFYEHLALAAESGYPLHEAVRSFLASEAPRQMKGRIAPLLFYLERGYPLEKAAALAFGFFSAAEAAALASAKAGDDLARMLRYLAEGQRQRRRFREGRKTLSLYLAETMFAILISSFMGSIAVPRYAEVIGYLVPERTLIVRALEWLALAAVHAVWVFPVFVILYFLARLALAHSMTFRRLVGRVVPPISEMWWASVLGRLTQSLSIQLSKHVPVESALETALGASGDPALQRQAPLLNSQLRQGKPLYRAFAAVRDIPRWFHVHLAVGAKRENLPSLLSILAQSYQRRAACLAEMLEMVLAVTLIVITVGFFVCFVACFYMVMFSIYGFLPYE